MWDLGCHVTSAVEHRHHFGDILDRLAELLCVVASTFDKLKFCFEVYDRDGNQSIEREELQDMFTSMLLNGESVTMDEISPEMRELIVDFVDGIYDTFDADHSESLEFDEVMQALQKSPEIDVWEVFGRTLINSS